MASGGGGTGKISSGPLKGKVVYLTEGEITGLAKAAGLTYTDAFLAMKAGNNPVIQAGVQFLADTGAKPAKESLADKIAATVAAKTKAQQAAAEAAAKAQQLAAGALVAQELNDKIAGKATNAKQVVANPDGTYTLYTKQGSAITYDSAAKVAAVVDAFTGAASATPVAAAPADPASGTPKPKAAPGQAKGTSTVNPADYAALGLPAPATTLDVQTNQTIPISLTNGTTKEVTGDVYDGKWMVQKDGSYYNITITANGQWLTSVKTKGEAVAAIHSLMGPEFSDIDWSNPTPIKGLNPDTLAKLKKFKQDADLGMLKGIKAAQKGLKAPKASTDGDATPSAPKASKPSLSNYEAFSPSAKAPTVEPTTGSTYMTATYQGFPSKGFNVPDLDPVTLTYPNGKTSVVKAAGATFKAAHAKLSKWYGEWGKANGPGTPGYHVINNKYQSPVYRAMNMYLRWKGQGKSDAEIDTLLKTDSFVTYKGTIFNKYQYGNYHGIEQEYTASGMSKLIGAMDKAMSGSPLPETTVMYRGISRGTKDNPNPIATEIFKASPGDILGKDDAYQSLSVNKNHSLNYATKPHLGGPGAMLTVIVPKGTKGAYLPAKGGITSEYEYLLARGARYRLLSKQTDAATGLIHAVVELVEQD